jgi:deoxyribodipyrimidine photolyase-like uncharacterized protein
MGARLGKCEILLESLPRCVVPTRVGAWTGPVMTVLRIIFGDQLFLDLSALDHFDPGRDVIMMMEVMEENIHAGHRKQKIVLVLAAMRHFAEMLRRRDLTVDYADQNALHATHNLSAFGWSGATGMRCLREEIGRTAKHGYSPLFGG